MSNVQYGCECTDCDTAMSRCGGVHAPVAFSVKRDRTRIKVCTRCDIAKDRETRKLLVDDETEIKPFLEYDALGAVCLAYLAEGS